MGCRSCWQNVICVKSCVRDVCMTISQFKSTCQKFIQVVWFSSVFLGFFLLQLFWSGYELHCTCVHKYMQWYFGHTVPRLMPTVTNSCDEEEIPQNSSQNLHKYPWCNTLSLAMGIFVHFSLNWTPWHLVPWPLEHNCPNQGDGQIANINITTICTIYMLLDVIWSLLGNKEFELVVFGMTFAVVTRRLASGHGILVLSVGDR